MELRFDKRLRHRAAQYGLFICTPFTIWFNMKRLITDEDLWYNDIGLVLKPSVRINLNISFQHMQYRWNIASIYLLFATQPSRAVLVGPIFHYNDVIMSAMASQITGVSIVCSIFCSGADQRKHQSSASLAFVRGIHHWPVNSPHKGPVTRKMFPFDDVTLLFETSTVSQPLLAISPVPVRQSWAIYIAVPLYAPHGVLNHQPVDSFLDSFFRMISKKTLTLCTGNPSVTTYKKN